MRHPKNKIASDKEIIDAIKKHNNYKDAANYLGMAKNTLSNRVSLMKKKEPDEPRPSTYRHKMASRYFVSCVVSDAPLHKRFVQSVRVMCDHLEAESIYIPVQYDWSDVRSGRHVPTYPKSLSDKLLSEDVSINEHLYLMGSVPIHATVQNPLMGMKHISHNKSAIFAHPQRAMESVATPKSKIPKLIYTTGAATEARYTRSKAGRKAQDLHTIGGLLIETDGDKFFIFEITANSKGEFYHLTNKYTPRGVQESDSIAGVYMADEHAEGYSELVRHATYTSENSIVNTLMPELVIRGDVYNHGSDNHHNRSNVLGRIIREMNGTHDVKEELNHCFNHIKETTSDFYKNVIVASNHHDHLKRWLNEFNPHTGAANNVWLYHQLNALMIGEAIETNSTDIDPFELFGRHYFKDVHEKCIFLGRDEEFLVAGVAVDMHGDIGPNGARGSAANLSMGGQPINIGHGHSPRIYRNVRQVGVGAMELGYNKGYSGWMATHNVIYHDGTQTMVHIINGEWRL